MFFDGERVARKNFSSGAVSYYFSDHLKTASVITDSAGNIKEDEDYYPWGGELQFVNNDSNHYKFTGKERDSETGLDYFGARYYGSWLGRFMSADWAAKPEAVPYSDLHDPQSLNLYSYVRNIPTVNIDPDGHQCASVCSAPAPTAEEVQKALDSVKRATQAAEEAEAATTVGEKAVGRVLGPAVAVGVVAVDMAYPESVSAGDKPMNTARSAPTAEEMEQIRETIPEPQTSTSGAGARRGGGKPYDATKENLDNMKQGKPPVGTDGKKVELHHNGQTTNSPLVEMTQTQHRGKGNFTTNHQNTGQRPSQVNRSQANKARSQHWKNEYEKHTGGN